MEPLRKYGYSILIILATLGVTAFEIREIREERMCRIFEESFGIKPDLVSKETKPGFQVVVDVELWLLSNKHKNLLMEKQKMLDEAGLRFVELRTQCASVNDEALAEDIRQKAHSDTVALKNKVVEIDREIAEALKAYNRAVKSARYFGFTVIDK